tara:strand:- start:161 stop:1183 length:1023 start_codon:yes stop_codon:yes gene_type:complete
MTIAQRGSSSTTSGYGTVDRFACYFGGTDEAVTQAQVDVSSGTTPYTLGFRKALKITNGNQTSGAGAGDDVQIQTRFEAQDIAQSGWNYTSASSFITLSFWVKSSVAQNFYWYLRTKDGTDQRYAFETGSLSADTWTKITKTIPGNSNLQFDNNNENGLELIFGAFFGTDYTDSGVSLNAWGAYSGSTRTPDYTSTWYTTNDATFELTGVQLEVGSVATDFEHRSIGQELALCQRYFYAMLDGNGVLCENASMYNSASPHFSVPFPVTMRTAPSLEVSNNSGDFAKFEAGSGSTFNTISRGSVTTTRIAAMDANASGTAGNSVLIRGELSTAKVHWSAEL